MTRSPEERRLIFEWRRDRSVYTEKELRDRWTGNAKQAMNEILKGTFERTCKDHNPIYYLAQTVWFDRKLKDRRYLYAPLHRDIFCKNILLYLLGKIGEGALGMLLKAPRWSYKSTFFHGVGPMFAAFRWKEVRGIDATQLLLHHKEEKASRNLVRLKKKYQFHPWLRENWPEFCPPRNLKDWGTKTEFTLPNAPPGEGIDPSFTACGIKASQTGAHYDIRWHDDLVTEDHINSSMIRNEAKMKYGANRFTMDLVEGKELNSGTPYHVNDLWSVLEKTKVKDKSYLCITIPAWKNYPRKAYKADLAHPYRLPEAELEERRQEIIARDGSDLMWWLQYQCEARSSHLIATEPEWLKRCAIADYPDLEGAWKCLIIDPAWKGSKNHGEGCFAAGGVWAFLRVDNTIKRFLLDGFYSNEMTSLDGETESIKLCEKWGLYDVAPEDNFDKGFGTSLQKSASDKGLEINLIELKGRYKNKNDRIVDFERHTQAGHYYIVQDTCPVHLIQALQEQHDDFPQSDPRDAIDMAAYSNDPEVLSFVPVYSKRQKSRWPFAPEPRQESYYARRTRYTSL